MVDELHSGLLVVSNKVFLSLISSRRQANTVDVDRVT